MQGSNSSRSSGERAPVHFPRKTARERDTHSGARVLVQTSQALAQAADLQRVVDVTIEACSALPGVDAVGLWVADAAQHELVLLAHDGFSELMVTELSRISLEGPFVAARAARAGRPQLVEDLELDADLPQIVRSSVASVGARSLLAAPLISRQRLVGVVEQLSRTPRRFSAADRDLTAGIAGLIAVAIDNAHLHRDLLERERQIGFLLKRAVDAQESERQRVCIEVHDGVVPTLESASVHLQELKELPELPPGPRASACRGASLVADALAEVRRAVAGLRPPSLDALGLVPTLDRELAALRAETALEIELAAEPIELPSAVETAVYRIVREAVGNVVKHASARRLVVELRQAPSTLLVTIRDDGQGFDLAALERSGHLRGIGLVGVRRRVELLGGTCQIRTGPGEGTEVAVKIPLPRRSGEGALRPTDGGSSRASSSVQWARPIPVLVVDDHLVAREGLRAMLESDGSARVVGEAGDALQAVELALTLRPAVVLIDLRMPGTVDVLEAIRRIKLRRPSTVVVAMAESDDDGLAVEALQAGAGGCVPKGASRDQIRQAIEVATNGGVLVAGQLLRRELDELVLRSGQRAIPDGGPSRRTIADLTERELAVLQLLADGRTNREIGEQLGYAEITVKRTVQSIVGKLRVEDRTKALIAAVRLGLVR